jgi:Domain of unknown function (DUF3387)
VVQARSFTELLERSIRRYQNRAIETAQVIEELILNSAVRYCAIAPNRWKPPRWGQKRRV